MEKNEYQILLYYKYVDVSSPEKIKDEQQKLCEKLNLKGRIIIAREGINGTIEGTTKATEKYIAEMKKQPLFASISYKKSVGTGNAFPKLRIRVRPEIVTAGLPQLNPNHTTGKYITAEELHAWFKEKSEFYSKSKQDEARRKNSEVKPKEFYVVDMRNDYEYASGFFDGFIPSKMRNFYELKEILPRLMHLKEKTIVTVCTGGVRCEKASGFLVENGFSHVYQLKDGIQTYMEKYPDSYFKGKLYVFDNRLTIGFHSMERKHEVVGKCMHCKNPCDTYVNCTYDICHLHYICCDNCLDAETGLAFCKEACKKIYLNVKNPLVAQA